ncbi:MAG: hypothetical protein ACT4OY_01365 [Alphaproteobacteria bacterium]
MLKIPADMSVTDTAEAQAMKLSSRKVIENADDRTDSNSSLQIAADLDEAADAYLIMTEIPMRGVGGEFVQTNENNPLIVCPPHEKVNRVNADASLDRLELIHQNGVLNMALDVAESTGAANAAEQMIAHQMAVAHRMSLDLMAQAGNIPDPVEKCRLINTASRLMDISQKALMTINKIHNRGEQVITVQRVEVKNGGQAVINGSVDARGRGADKK